jgi:hypothetical protein
MEGGEDGKRVVEEQDEEEQEQDEEEQEQEAVTTKYTSTVCGARRRRPIIAWVLAVAVTGNSRPTRRSHASIHTQCHTVRADRR